MIYRRQRQQYIFAGILAIIAVVNVLFFFILNRPTRVEYERLEQSITELDQQLGGSQGNFTMLSKTSTQLDRFDKDKKALFMMHLIQRSTGYSQIVETLNTMALRSGVKKTRASFNLDPEVHAGLNAVTVNLPLEGTYASVVNFIRELEESDTVFVIKSISLDGGAQSPGPVNVSNTGGGAGSTIDLALVLETYFYQ
jgi:Tfp pilus assembly protein PilO